MVACKVEFFSQKIIKTSIKKVMIKIQRIEDNMRKNNYIYNNNYISISVCLIAEIDTIL